MSRATNKPKHGKSLRRMRVHPSRSADYKAGHRAASRAAVEWLHRQAGGFQNSTIRAVVNGLADSLGRDFRAPRPPHQQKRKSACRLVFRTARDGSIRLRVVSPMTKGGGNRSITRPDRPRSKPGD